MYNANARNLTVPCVLNFQLFAFGLNRSAIMIPKNTAAPMPAAGECAENADLRNGLFNALGKRAAKARKRNGRAGSCPFDERRVKPDCLEYKSGDNVNGQYARRGELRFVDKDLTYCAQRAADGKNLDIFN